MRMSPKVLQELANTLRPELEMHQAGIWERLKDQTWMTLRYVPVLGRRWQT